MFWSKNPAWIWTLARLRGRQEDYVKTDLKEIEDNGLDTYGSEEGQAAHSYEHGNDASGSVKGGEFLD